MYTSFFLDFRYTLINWILIFRILNELKMSEQQHFEQLIVGMLNSSNDIRNMAEKEYEKISLQQKGEKLQKL